MDVFPASLPQAALTDFLEEGHFARHLRRMRSLYQERRGALVAALQSELGEQLEVLGAEAGLHLVAALRGRSDDRHLAELAAARGLWLLPLSTCYGQVPRRFGFVLGYGGTGLTQIAEGVRQLRRLFAAREGVPRRLTRID
jgi:GntR family transcriptional regulator/MocR family aminotransferase